MEFKREMLSDLSYLRPWLGEDGKSYVTMKGEKNRTMVKPSKIQARIKQSDWDILDITVSKTFRREAPFTNMLLSSVPDNNFCIDGRKQSTLEDKVYPREPSEDKPLYELRALPLPITYCDQNVYNHLISTYLAARKMSQLVEQTVLGKCKAEEGKAQLYGICNHPKRLLIGFEDLARIDQVKRMIELLQNCNFYGPYAVVRCDPRDGLDGVFENQRKQFLNVPEITRVVDSELFRFAELAIVQLTADVIRMVQGLYPTVVQEQESYRALCVEVPQIREDMNGVVGICHFNC